MRTLNVKTGDSTPRADAATRPDGRIEILQCRTDAQLLEAQRLRYTVYCSELGRSSSHADHDKRILSDDLDKSGHTFIAREGEQTAGTIRLNFAWEGSFGIYEELYDSEDWRRLRARAAICTKLAVKSSSRSSDALLRLVAEALRFVIRNDADACFIDSIPRLTPLYAKLGFVRTAEPFIHHENGLSDRLVLELATYRGLITGEDLLGGLSRAVRNRQAAPHEPAGR